MTWGRIFWPVYLITATLVFLGPEIYGLATGGQNTLSNWVWNALHVSPERFDIWRQSGPWYLALGVWVVLVSWLTFHFWFRRFT